MENSMWNELDLERILHDKLTTRFDKSTAESIWSDYIQIRKEAINIAEQIKAKEPTLTDHGPRENKCLYMWRFVFLMYYHYVA